MVLFLRRLPGAKPTDHKAAAVLLDFVDGKPYGVAIDSGGQHFPEPDPLR